MLPDSKTGRKAIHPSAPALALLKTIPRLEGNPYVICGEKPGQHLVNLEKLGAVSARLASSMIIGKMLSHSQPATTARYAHLADDPVKAASDAVGRHIAAAMSGGISGEVIGLPRSRKATPKLAQ
jgi:hypothetical protein